MKSNKRFLLLSNVNKYIKFTVVMLALVSSTILSSEASEIKPPEISMYGLIGWDDKLIKKVIDNLGVEINKHHNDGNSFFYEFKLWHVPYADSFLTINRLGHSESCARCTCARTFLELYYNNQEHVFLNIAGPLLKEIDNLNEQMKLLNTFKKQYKWLDYGNYFVTRIREYLYSNNEHTAKSCNKALQYTCHFLQNNSFTWSDRMCILWWASDLLFFDEKVNKRDLKYSEI